MEIQSTLRVALRSLQRHKMRSALTMLGIIIGIAAVVSSVSFGEGADRMVQAQIENMGTNRIYVFAGSMGRGGVHQGWGSVSTLRDVDAKAIARDCSAVKLVSAGVETHVQVVYAGQNWFTDMNGVDVGFSTGRNWPMAEGAFFDEEEVRAAANVVVIGQTVKDYLFGNEDPLGKTIRVKNLPFRVVGVLSVKGLTPFGQDQDDRIEMPYTTAQKKITGNPYLQFIAVSSIDRNSVFLAMNEISQVLRERHHLRPDEDDDFGVRSMTQAQQAASASGQVMTLLLAGVASISLLVGGIGIMNIMLVSVTERTKEIGIRMATGATDSDIRWQFILEAVVLSLLGGFGGMAAGVVLARSIARVFGWPSFVSLPALLTAAAFSGLVGIFFGYYPAAKASRLDPIVALRFE